EHVKAVVGSRRCSPELRDTLRMLVAWTLPPDIVHIMRFNTTDWLPSAVACFWNWADILPALLERERQSHPQALSPKGRGPLQAAAAAGSLACVELLLKMGIAPVIDPSVGDQAIHFAAFCNRVNVIPSLLNAGADPTLLSLTSMNNTPLHDTVFA